MWVYQTGPRCLGYQIYFVIRLAESKWSCFGYQYENVGLERKEVDWVLYFHIVIQMPVTIPLVVIFFDIAIKLQQGDTLSPILFVLVMNDLGKMI